MIEVNPAKNIVFTQGVIGVSGMGFNQLNAPYDAKVVGDYTGLTPRSEHMVVNGGRCGRRTGAGMSRAACICFDRLNFLAHGLFDFRDPIGTFQDFARFWAVGGAYDSVALHQINQVRCSTISDP